MLHFELGNVVQGMGAFTQNILLILYLYKRLNILFVILPKGFQAKIVYNFSYGFML